MRPTLLLFALTLMANAGDLPHFRQVQPEIYRGAQPKPEQFATLAKMGVGTVVSLRSTGPQIDQERRIVESLGMRFVNVPLRGYQTPSDANIQKALAELDLAKQTGKPVFVHCKLGKDRTGTVVACYRIKREGWNQQKALQEAKALGMSYRQKKMQQYVLAFQ